LTVLPGSQGGYVCLLVRLGFVRDSRVPMKIASFLEKFDDFHFCLLKCQIHLKEHLLIYSLITC
jgi:hypothetical protein